MTSATRATIESYIQSAMRRLCLNGTNEPFVQDVVAFEEFFGIHARFDIFVMAVGDPESSTPLALASDLPDSLRGSTEHRFRLRSWPLYDFVVCQSIAGYAWGHRFERIATDLAPPIDSVIDLQMWSHTMDEITRALGEPVDLEGWYPWASGTFSVAGRSLRLCFVFDLLQCFSDE